MSYSDCEAPTCSDSSCVALLIEPRERDLGQFSVRRVLPASRQDMVGPFVFFDHMGPAVFPPGQSINVRPHPHIGIATITYLFEGEILHRDSLGVVQPIYPGAVNLMTAGCGIVHSERPGDDVDRESRLHGIQSWIALPANQQEMAPAFRHFPAQDLPQVELAGARVTVIMGEAFGAISPVTTYSRTVYLDCQLAAGADLTLTLPEEELALYVVEGAIAIDETTIAAGVMAVLNAADAHTLTARGASRVMVVGGDNIGPRHMFWNFVSDSFGRIEQAKRDWLEGRFPPVPDDDEFIPLPD